jgi:hypothetical protein
VPQWGWIIIFATGVPLAVVLTWAVLKRGGTIGIGKNSIVIHGDTEDPGSPLGDALEFVKDSISQIHSLIYQHYLKIVKSKGIDPAVMTNLEDSKFTEEMLLEATSLGNGSNSIQKIVEGQIAKQIFRGKDIESYVRGVVLPRAVDSVRRVVNAKYDSIVHDTAFSTRVRVVSQAEFVEMLLGRQFQDELVERLVAFFRFASECLDGGCHD